MNGKDNRGQSPRFTVYFSGLLVVVLLLGASSMFSLTANAQDADESEGYTYTVEDGDNWDSVAAKTGVKVEALQAANPDSVRDTGWLLTGEELVIPATGEEKTQTYTVSAGESWSTIAARNGISMAALQAANQKSVRPGMILYNGEKLIIPPRTPATATPTTEETEVQEPVEEGTDATVDESAGTEASVEAPPTGEEAIATETPAAVEDEVVEPEVTATEEASAAEETPSEEIVAEETPVAEAETEADATETAAETSEEISPTVPMTETVIEAEVPEIAAPATEEETAAPPECPEALADYPDSILAVLNGSDGSAEALNDFLSGCGAAVEDGVVVADLTGDGVDDFVIAYQNPSQESAFVESDLIIVSLGEDGYEVAYRARAAGEVRLLSTDDINQDGQSDVAWVDTTCGASTCFDTVNVRSWDGSVWADWTDGTITMAYADIELTDVSDEGSGQEIELTGGIYGSVGAGPQRSRTETWASIDGEPYVLADKVYSASECLYHTVLDANRALSEAENPEDLAAAKALYENAVTDETLIKCWVRPAELEELRSFSLFRLAAIEAYEGNMEAAADRVTELAATYPESPLVEVAQTWLDKVEAGDAFPAACEAVTTFADEHPEVWEILSDYGYTNPSFEASDLCPPPLQAGEDAGDDSEQDGATGASPRSDLEGSSALSAEGEDAAGEAGESRDDAIAAIAENLPDCPASLVDYADALPIALDVTAGDTEILERWLYACGGLAEDRGALLTADLNADDIEDYVIFPTVISDVGLGPDGAQGGVYIFHGLPGGGYELAASPEVFGKPVPLAIEDLNGDDNVDVAWTVEGCSTFCMLETQIVTWDGAEYVSLIQPGATIASGEASFEEIKTVDTATGKALVLRGGVSGTPEGGLTVKHEEVWQSIDGAPFRRISWQYDSEDEGSNCLGLRLIEADVALQAADVLGYGPAFEKYARTLEPGLEACSIFGLTPDDELALLNGLANFRFIQVQALDGDLEGAEASLNYFTEQLPDSPYVQAAQQWLDEFAASGDAAAACDMVYSIFEDNPDMWQITDHFGYNHPALAAEQICYVPTQ